MSLLKEPPKYNESKKYIMKSMESFGTKVSRIIPVTHKDSK